MYMQSAFSFSSSATACAPAGSPEVQSIHTDPDLMLLLLIRSLAMVCTSPDRGRQVKITSAPFTVASTSGVTSTPDSSPKAVAAAIVPGLRPLNTARPEHVSAVTIFFASFAPMAPTPTKQARKPIRGGPWELSSSAQTLTSNKNLL